MAFNNSYFTQKMAIETQEGFGTIASATAPLARWQRKALQAQAAAANSRVCIDMYLFEERAAQPLPNAGKRARSSAGIWIPDSQGRSILRYWPVVVANARVSVKAYDCVQHKYRAHISAIAILPW